MNAVAHDLEVNAIPRELRDDILDRRRRFEREMERRELDAVVVGTEGNTVYFTGYETTFWVNKSKPFFVVLAPGRQPLVVCHVGEATSVSLDSVDVDVRAYAGPNPVAREERTDFDFHFLAIDTLLSVLADLGGRRIGMEMGWHFVPSVSPDALDHLRSRIAPAEIVDASPGLWAVRSRKSAWEIAHMRRGAEALHHAHELFAERAHTGMTERELSRLITQCGIEAGGERVTYTGIVAGTDRAGLGGPTDRVWRPGQLLGVDLTITVRNYWSDFCRVYAGRHATDAQREAYAELAATLGRARNVLRPGMTVGQLAETLLLDERHASYSRVGHGLGLDMPEPPSLVVADDTPLEPGMVICLEPNCEFPGVGWLTVEEMVVVTADGCELLGPAFPQQLSTIE
jgi:Xaa-Pro aminopeptidase